MIWFIADGEDPDDSLEVKEVYGFGKRTLLVRVVQDGEECQMNLTEHQAEDLAFFLGVWLCAKERSADETEGPALP